MDKEEIEELEDENAEIETETTFNLYWTCPKCKEDNVEYDIWTKSIVKCVCAKCNKKYEYYSSIY